jgi:DNA polymerase III subunit delta'
MNLSPSNQVNLYGLENQFKELMSLYNKAKLPNKILLSGQKGSGKSTLAYHLINFVLSKNEDYSYDIKNLLINVENKSFKLVQNKSNPNFTLIDVPLEKKTIDITQIRDLILNIKKSSFNTKPRFVLIDNIEYLNINSINALLKILEEPIENTYFILIHNNKKILQTLKSRFLNFKISLSNKNSIEISNKILDMDIYEFINQDLINYYFTPGKLYNLINFSKRNSLDLKKIQLKDFLSLIIDETYYKKDSSMKYMIYDFIELFLVSRFSFKYSDLFTQFLQRIENTRKYNLDEESLFMEFKAKLLNG